MNLKQAELEKRSSELDAREKFIDEKQKLLANSSITFKVYEARIKAYESQLSEIRQTIASAENIKNNNEVNFNKDKAIKRRLMVEADQKYADLQTNIADLESIKQEQDKVLRSVMSEIKKQDDYLKKQEAVIEESISMGNDRLLELQDAHNGLEDDIRAKTSQRVLLERQIDDLKVSFGELDQMNAEAIAKYELHVVHLENEIANIIKRVDVKSQEYKQICSDVDNKLSQLKLKEESLLTKQNALQLDRQQLETEKRRYNNAKALYDA